MELGSLIDSLAKPAPYPYGVEVVEVCQIPIFAVFLAGPYVYKIKKLIKLDFLDLSTLERRRLIVRRTFGSTVGWHRTQRTRIFQKHSCRRGAARGKPLTSVVKPR